MLSYSKLFIAHLARQRARARQLAQLDALSDHLRRDIGMPVRDADLHAALRRSLNAYGW